MVIDWIKDKLERRPEPFTWTDPEYGSGGVGIVHTKNEELKVLCAPAKYTKPHYKGVQCLDAQALVAYLARHAKPGESIVFANESGLTAVTNYCRQPEATAKPEDGAITAPAILDQAGYGDRVVSMLASWSPDCAAAMAAIEAAAGRWISLDTMESLLDVAAPFIKDVLKVRDVLLDLDGVEAVSAKRTANGSSLQVGSSVQAKEDRQIPGSMVFGGRFMGQAVVMEMPLRVRVQTRAIQFHIVDNGAIRKAKMEAVSQAAQAVRAAGWFVTEGSIA